MDIKTYLYKNKKWSETLDKSMDSKNTLVIIFGSTNIQKINNAIYDLVKSYPKSTIVGASTSGEIYGNEIFYNSLSVSVVRFQKSNFKVVVKNISETNSYKIGKEIVQELPKKNLKSIFILSSVLNVNGSELTKGLSTNIAKECVISGGLAGDGIEFNKTWIFYNSQLMKKQACAVGLYGNNLHVHNRSKSGWTRFGLDRKVTHSEKNVLYTLDNKPALELYKKYLGKYASDLPTSGLYFPLMLLEEGYKEPKLRAIKAINEEKNSITLAGSIPQNSMVSFAKANFDDLIDSSQEVAENIKKDYTGSQKALCLCISCVARKFVLKQEAEDEIEVVTDSLGKNISTIGFYSYGEISQIASGGCDFHNQTMTLMLIYESMD